MLVAEPRGIEKAILLTFERVDADAAIQIAPVVGALEGTHECFDSQPLSLRAVEETAVQCGRNMRIKLPPAFFHRWAFLHDGILDEVVRVISTMTLYRPGEEHREHGRSRAGILGTSPWTLQ